MKYTGWCQNDFNVQGYSSPTRTASGSRSCAQPAHQEKCAATAQSCRGRAEISSWAPAARCSASSSCGGVA
jgi:hypothetical protein